MQASGAGSLDDAAESSRQLEIVGSTLGSASTNFVDKQAENLPVLPLQVFRMIAAIPRRNATDTEIPSRDVAIG